MFMNITCLHKNYNIYLSVISYVYKGFLLLTMDIQVYIKIKHRWFRIHCLLCPLMEACCRPPLHQVNNCPLMYVFLCTDGIIGFPNQGY